MYAQYDQLVGSGTVLRPGGDAAVVRLTPSDRAVAVALDGDGARVALDPRRGGREAVAQAVLNVACSGADPAAITNCLNFGNPERPGTAYALREAISGMAEACQAFETPVVSGNVSLYNEHSGSPIHPTPVVGAVGVLERAELAVPSFPATDARRSCSWVRRCRPTTAASGRRSRTAWRRVASPIPHCPSSPACRGARRGGAERAARLGARRLGRRARRRGGRALPGRRQRLRARATPLADRGDITLFGEACGNVLVTCAPAGRARLAEICRRHGVPRRRARPRSAGERIVVRAGSCAVDVALGDARASYENALPLAMEPR